MIWQTAKVQVLGIVTATALTSIAQAQFHNKTKTGATTVNPQAIQQAQQQQAAQMSGQPVGMGLGLGANSTMFMSDAQRAAFARNNPQLGKMDEKHATIWGRAIHHTDGSFTESKQDSKTKTLEQVTKKGKVNPVTIQRRMILLDDSGRPSEVMIYDGRGEFKYRGVQVYDRMGRFSEEQLYDPDGKLIRRKVQEYAQNGEKLPLRSVDYVENVPEDLKLVITRESETTQVADASNSRRPVQATASPPSTGGSNGAEAQSGSKKGLNLGRLFSRSRDK